MLRPLAVLIVVLLGSQSLYAMKRHHTTALGHVPDPAPIAAAMLVAVLPILMDESTPKKKLKVSFADEPEAREFEKHEGEPTGKLNSNKPKIRLKRNSTDGMRKASELHIRLNEMETANHVFRSILDLTKLIKEKESLSMSSLDIETTKQFIKLIFNGADLSTAISTIQNTLQGEITGAQFYDLLVNLAAFYPNPILSPFILEKMIKQTDAELFSMLTLEDGSMLSFIINFYLTLAEQPETGLSSEILRDHLAFILRQGRSQAYRFESEIERIVGLILD